MSAPAYKAFGMKHGEIKMNRDVSKLAGLTESPERQAASRNYSLTPAIPERRFVTVIAKRHPAGSRFSRKFWAWASEAVAAGKAVLGL